jgi:hypothetical protein
MPNGDEQLPVSQAGGTPLGLSGGAPTSGTQGTDPKLQEIIKQIFSQAQQAQQQRQQLVQPTPRPMSPQAQTEVPGQPGQRGHDWGQAIANIGGVVQQAGMMHAQTQYAHAKSQWDQLNSMIQKDPSGQQAQQWLIANQKNLKQMAKALNQDWLNPQKTGVWDQAYKDMLKEQQAKGQARKGLTQLVKQLIGKANQQPKLTPDQQQGMAKEMMSKAPTQTPPVDFAASAKTAIDVFKAESEDAYRRAEVAATMEEKKAALAQAKAIADQTHEIEKLRIQYDAGIKEATLAETTRHHKEDEAIGRSRVSKMGGKVSPAEQDKRDKLAGAQESLNQMVTKYKASKETDPVSPEDQQVLTGMFNVFSGAQLPKKAQSWLESVFKGPSMTVGQARTLQKLSKNFKVTHTDAPDDGIDFTPEPE